MNRSDRPRLVLHVIDSLGRVGGAEEQMLENLRRFRDERLEHRILCLYELDSNDRSDEVPAGVEVAYLYPPSQVEPARTAMVRDMLDAVRSIGPDLIHCALPNAGLAARVAGRRLSIPVIESLVNISHESIRTVDNPAVVPWKLMAHRLLDRASMRSVTRFQALSQAVARSWIETVGIPKERVVVIPRGVNLDRFPNSGRDDARRSLLAELQLPEDTLLVLNVGRQVPQKGQLYALRALPSLLVDQPSAALLSAGTAGPMTDRLVEESRQLGVADRVFWLGVRRDIPRLLAAADIFLFPSLYEGLGVSLLEAMASGLACVTTNQAPMTEVITDRKNGLLVPAMDAEEIADALIELAGSPELRRELGCAAREHIAASYASTGTAARVEELYQDVLGLDRVSGG